MPILSDKFPFVQKSSRTLVSYVESVSIQFWSKLISQHACMNECDCTEAMLSVHTGVLRAQPVESFSLHPWPEERYLRAHHQQDAHARCEGLVQSLYWYLCNCAAVWRLFLTFRLVHHGVRLKKWKVELSKMLMEHHRTTASLTWWVQHTSENQTHVCRTYSVGHVKVRVQSS